MDEDTGLNVSEDALSDYINEYFSTIGSKLAAKCTPGMLPGETPLFNRIPFAFDRTPFSEEEVLEVCKEINVYKSASIENVKCMVLKDAFTMNIHKITKIFNSSLSFSIFPQQWKLSTIVPLPKVSHPTSASDLRPVALTPLPGKLMEKLVCKRLQKWLKDNNILSEFQHGFRKKKSTISAVASFLDDIYKIINEKLNPLVIFLDFKKAFDTISHKKLINKLQKMGLDIVTLSWFNRYLTQRHQCVKVNNNMSGLLPITYGVPQGSILGPILFSIYINEIVDIVNCGIVLYADDTVIYHHDKNVLQDNLDTISRWCNANLLTINVKKSHWMKLKVCTGQEVNLDYPKFEINKLKLSEVDTYKYLGLYIDVNLNFQNHHKKMIASVNSKQLHFRRIRRLINQKAALLIYKCTILPIMEYADFIQDQSVVYVNKAVQKLHNFGLLIAYNQHNVPYYQRDSSETLHGKAKLFRLVHRRNIHLLLFVFQLKSNVDLLDNRDIPTRRREGIIVFITKIESLQIPEKTILSLYVGMESPECKPKVVT